jgi:hypothetical protein
MVTPTMLLLRTMIYSALFLEGTEYAASSSNTYVRFVFTFVLSFGIRNSDAITLILKLQVVVFFLQVVVIISNNATIVWQILIHLFLLNPEFSVRKILCLPSPTTTSTASQASQRCSLKIKLNSLQV